MMTPALQSSQSKGSKRVIHIVSSDDELQITGHRPAPANPEKRPRLESRTPSNPFDHRQNSQAAAPVASSSRLPAIPAHAHTELRTRSQESNRFQSSVSTPSRGNSQATSSATLVNKEHDLSGQPESGVDFSYKAPIAVAEPTMITDDEGEDDYTLAQRLQRLYDAEYHLSIDSNKVKETRNSVDALFRASINEEPDIFDMEPTFDETPIPDERGLSRPKAGKFTGIESEECDDLEERFKAMELGGMSKADIDALRAFGRNPLAVASGGTCSRLEFYQRSQLPRFPSGRKRLSGFHLTGRFTGMRPPRRGM